VSRYGFEQVELCILLYSFSFKNTARETEIVFFYAVTSVLNIHKCKVLFVNRHFLLCSLVTAESGPSPSASPGAPTLWPEVIIQGPLSEAPGTVEGLSTRNKVPPLPGEVTATKTNSFSQVSRSYSILPVTVLSLDIRTRIFQSPLRFRNSSCYLKLLTEPRP